ncbi:hypothetical protein JIN85_01735 [Luteolibacter pohnpeiensis]|uniref:Uncharacterized protein n=1 Tax=Luteolibacter pohnpeiensis TaxID=454153 RepID=A0A934S3A5_9BACT|nr:DUF6404 family protein [Luteolibacter pohnpeiensis]MBK1881113.1 hypothetical protein [Luteolibacter pohnpeiensis]
MANNSGMEMPRCAEKLMQLGVSPQLSAPAIHRWFWRMGLAIQPPIYATGAQATLVRCLLLSLLWTCSMWLIAGKSLSGPLLAGSLTFGLIVALYRNFELLHLRKKLHLPSLKDLLEDNAESI